MYSLRYGTIPVVRATGGLDDSVIDYTQDTLRANGIKFQEYSARCLGQGHPQSLGGLRAAGIFRRFRQNAMQSDFSWDQTVANI